MASGGHCPESVVPESPLPHSPPTSQPLDYRGLREVEEDHLNRCDQFPVPCPNGCETGSGEGCSLEQHLLECPLQLVDCEYAAMGCDVRLPQKDMSEHIRQSGQEHLLKICLENLTLSKELSRKVEDMEEQIADLQEEMSMNVENVRKELAIVHSEVYSGKIPPVEYTIHAISILRAQRSEWRSPPFYTHKNGYKMCLGVFPNKMDKKNNVAIWFYKMRGANTRDLRWPVQLTVTIHLLNQSTGEWEREHTDNGNRYKPSREIESSNFGLFNLCDPELAPYVKDDCLCIRVASFTVS